MVLGLSKQRPFVGEEPNASYDHNLLHSHRHLLHHLRNHMVVVVVDRHNNILLLRLNNLFSA